MRLGGKDSASTLVDPEIESFSDDEEYLSRAARIHNDFKARLPLYELH